jgi:stringent starvation protein B
VTPKRPYLIRALYQWVLDNGLTPHVLVDADREGVNVPRDHVQGGRVVLNISPTAVKDLHLGNDRVEMGARFGGVAWRVTFPVAAVLAIYARENGQGMAFPDVEPGDGPPPEPPPPEKRPPERPGLRIVK